MAFVHGVGGDDWDPYSSSLAEYWNVWTRQYAELEAYGMQGLVVRYEDLVLDTEKEATQIKEAEMSKKYEMQRIEFEADCRRKEPAAPSPRHSACTHRLFGGGRSFSF